MFKTFALLRWKELSTPYLWSGHEVLMCVHSSMNYGPLIFRGPLIKRIKNVFFIRRIQDVNTVLWSPSLTLCQLRSSNKNITSPGIFRSSPAVVGYVWFLSVAVDNLKVSPSVFFFSFQPSTAPGFAFERPTVSARSDRVQYLQWEASFPVVYWTQLNTEQNKEYYNTFSMIAKGFTKLRSSVVWWSVVPLHLFWWK